MSGATAVAILLPCFALALVLKVAARWLLAPRPRARIAAERCAIWVPISAVLVVLTLVAWPLALVLAGMTVVCWIALRPEVDRRYGTDPGRR